MLTCLARTRDLPCGIIDDRRIQHDPEAERCVGEIPGGQQAAVGVLEDEIAVAVTIQIGNRRNSPMRISGSHRQVHPGGQVGAVHAPDGEGPLRAVLPEQIGIAIAIRITDANDLPLASRRRRIGEDGLQEIHPVQEPNRELPRRSVLPDDIGMAVVVHVGDRPDLPVGIRQLAGRQRHAGAEVDAIEQTHRELTAVRLEEEIGGSIAIDIARGGDAPAEQYLPPFITYRSVVVIAEPIFADKNWRSTDELRNRQSS